jgi:hypothetical protein
VACATLLLGLAAGALAAKTKTQIDVYDYATIGKDKSVLFGKLLSDKSKCLADRRVEFLIRYTDGPPRQEDRILSTDDGAFAGQYDNDDFTETANGILVRVAEKQVGKTTCAAKQKVLL